MRPSTNAAFAHGVTDQDVHDHLFETYFASLGEDAEKAFTEMLD
jgi:hypothetical protein